MLKRIKNFFQSISRLQKKSSPWRLLFQFLGITALAFASNAMLQWFQNDLNLNLVFSFIFSWHTEKFLISTLVLLILALWLWALLGNVWLAGLLFFLVNLLMGVATYTKMQERNEPVYPSDMVMLGNFDLLWQMLHPETVWLLLTITAVFGGGIFVLFKKYRSVLRQARLPWKGRLVLGVAATLCLLYVAQFQEPGNKVKALYDDTAYWIPYSQQMNYYNNGFVAGFLYNLASDPMSKPDGYSRSAVTGIVEKYQQLAEEINAGRENESVEANVVYVMNESFADPLQLEGLELKEDPIPLTRRLADESISGEMLSQGYGGGTANIEYEALTGFSMEPFASNISTPYTQFLFEAANAPSIAWRLKEEGFRTTAVHPYDVSMYKRTENYQVLGFDEFLYEDTMTYVDTVGSNPYISDASAYQEVLKVMEESSATDFVHLVTMQNHTPYQNKYEDIPSYQETGVVDSSIRQYLQDLQNSDEALADFRQAIMDFPEPVIVVFWGDHWPNVFGEEIFSANEVTTMHETPFIIFANFDIPQEDTAVLSPIYFQTKIRELTGAKISGFEALLTTLEEEVPAFEKGMYYDKETGDYVLARTELSAEAQQLLQEYEWIQYDITTGGQYAQDLGFFE